MNKSAPQTLQKHRPMEKNHQRICPRNLRQMVRSAGANFQDATYNFMERNGGQLVAYVAYFINNLLNFLREFLNTLYI